VFNAEEQQYRPKLIRKLRRKDKSAEVCSSLETLCRANTSP